MLLTSYEFSKELQQAINESQKKITILSAFVKHKAATELLAKIDPKVNVKIVSRWQKRDLIYNASDIALYKLCKERNWELGIDINLHGKVYMIDEKNIFLGSANLTQRGLNTEIRGNVEFGNKISANRLDTEKIYDYLGSNVTWVDDQLYKKLINEIEEYPKDLEFSERQLNWTSEIMDDLSKPVEYLWVDDLLFASPNNLINFDFDDDQCLHDYELLSLNIDQINKDSLRNAFLRTKACKWLKDQIKAIGDMNFGALSCTLHNALLEDPKPYRSEVKEYVAILFEWAELLPDVFKIMQHHHTKSLCLVDS